MRMIVGTALPSYSTLFPLTENPISENGAWFSPNANWTRPRTIGGIAYGTQVGSSAPPYDDSIACLTDSRWPAYPNHFAQGVIHRTGSALSQEVELFLRANFTNTNASGVEVDIKEGAAFHLILWNGVLNDFAPMATDITTNVNCADGSVFKSWFQGPLVFVTCNDNVCIPGGFDVQAWVIANIGTYPTAVYPTTGYPGMGFWDISGAPHDAFAWDAFSAGVV